ncbi:MAG TPA: energy transducer TonB [Thermoanaerobaculia bacterium]|nr:energy transducer TonB [Thermoanaerobaculia bacterium]
MAKDDKPRAADQAPAQQGIAGSSLDTFAAEYDEDKRTMRWAVGFAIVIHLVILAIHLPDMVSAEQPEAEKQKVYVVQQVRFRPPPPQKQQEIPKPKAKKVPIPDPTPDEPEPIRTPDEIQPEIDLPETDIIFDIPEGPPPSEPEGPIHVGGDVKAPVKVSAPQPQYTEIARKARIQGVVIVQAIINKQGDVTDVKVLKGLPMGLDEAAVDAIRKWKFEPATLNGKPVDVYYNLTVNFTLQ